MAKDNMDASQLLRKVIEQQDGDVLREFMKVVLDMLMSAEADAGPWTPARSRRRAVRLSPVRPGRGAAPASCGTCLPRSQVRPAPAGARSGPAALRRG